MPLLAFEPSTVSIRNVVGDEWLVMELGFRIGQRGTSDDKSVLLQRSRDDFITYLSELIMAVGNQPGAC
jgi:hypothetical protein